VSRPPHLTTFDTDSFDNLQSLEASLPLKPSRFLFLPLVRRPRPRRRLEASFVG
jgi:hypothetical protein